MANRRATEIELDTMEGVASREKLPHHLNDQDVSTSMVQHMLDYVLEKSSPLTGTPHGKKKKKSDIDNSNGIGNRALMQKHINILAIIAPRLPDLGQEIARKSDLKQSDSSKEKEKKDDGSTGALTLACIWRLVGVSSGKG
ncbi:hypothetical protein Lser_V15G21323 [Lactuca serriola]